MMSLALALRSSARAHPRVSGRIVEKALLMTLLACACVKQGGAGTTMGPTLDPSAARGRDVLTAQELRSRRTLRGADAYEAISGLRPEYLRAGVVDGGQISVATPSVFVNDAFNGNIESLRSIPASLIEEAAFLRPAESRRRFGRDHAAGAILIRTQNRRRGSG
jgi:hypothetical protein